jgi:hypothetical protein
VWLQSQLRFVSACTSRKLDIRFSRNTKEALWANQQDINGCNRRISNDHRSYRPSFDQIYDFLADPKNWNQWAHGLGKSIRQSKDGWIADSDGGTIEVRFTPRNGLGVVDHYVNRPSGAQVYVPMRLIVSGQGCELLFTLFRKPQMSDQQFAADAGYVQRDLDCLRFLLEK